jgi:DNA polymerase-1
MERLMLLDGNGLIYRGYFALPPLTTSRGELVNAVFGFCSIVLRGFQDIRPDYVAVAFDLSGPTFRHERFAEYKANRQRMPDDLRDQFPKVREVVKALRIPVYEMAGYEADDVIGTLTVEAEARGLDTTIVTGDLDMLQLVTERTRLMTTRSGVQNTVIYDPERIAERYGLKPSQIVDFKALKGDSTDNVPGVAGIGEKTAAKLIAQFGDLDTLLSRIDEVTPARLQPPIVEAKERLIESRELMRIVRDLPVSIDLDAARLGDYDRDTVVRLFREYEFRTLIERLPGLSGERADETVEALRAETADGSFPAALVAGRPAGWGPAPADDGTRAPGGASGQRPGTTAGPGGSGGVGPAGAASHPRNELQLSLDFDALGGPSSRGALAPSPFGTPGPTKRLADAAALAAIAEADPRDALAAAIADPGSIALVDEAGVPAVREWLEAQPSVGASLVLDDPRPRRGSAIALALAGADGRTVAADGPEAASALRHLLEEVGTPLVGHEIKPLLVARFADEENAPAPNVAFDTQIAAYILNASLRSQTIADVVAEQLDLVLPPASETAPAARAGLEALSAIAVRPPLEAALARENLDRLFAEVELPLIAILARMEAIGVAIDRDRLSALADEFAAETTRLEAEIYVDVGHEFNLGSPKQLEQVLFFELNLPKGKRTKTGFSTDASVLEDLRAAHPMIDKLLEWRIYTKLRSTYVEALPTLIAESDGRLHTTFHQAVAATGRLSSSDPNLQNIPIRTPLGRRIRRAFVAGGPDVTLVAADYSQIELRILAHVSGDEHLKAAFARGADIHRDTAALVLHKDPADVTSDERSMAKMVNFGIAYGMSDFGLSSRANIPRAEAQAFINTYFATYSGISYYMLAIKEQARAQGYVSTLIGRKRHIPELAARNPTLRAAGERMAINMPIQGTAADIIKIAMIRLAGRLRAEGFRARLMLQVHDELLLEVPRDEVDRLIPVLRETMESAMPLDVPLTVDVKVGDDWEAMTPVTRADAVAAEADEPPGDAGSPIDERSAAPLAG